MSGTLVPAVAVLAVLIIVGCFVTFFRAKRNSERAAVRRAENEVLKHDAPLREEERRSAYAGRVRSTKKGDR